MSRFRLHTASGDTLAVPDDADVSLFLDEDGILKMRTEICVDSVDIGLMTLEASSGGSAPRDGGRADLRNQHEGRLSVDIEDSQRRSQSLQHCPDEGSEVLGHAGCPCAPLVDALLALGDPETLLRDCSGVDVSVLQPLQHVEDLVVARGESMKLLVHERVQSGDDLAQFIERVSGLSLRGPKVLDLRTQLGDLCVALRMSLALVPHDSSSVGGDDVGVGAPASSTGSGASEPTEEVPPVTEPRTERIWW